MSTMERPGSFPTAKLARGLVLAALAALCVLSIRNWIGRLNLSPDSTTYLTAAGNLTRTGRLFYFANAASWSMEPEVEPYTEQPPGFVYFLVPFVLILRDPIHAAVAAQGAAIVLFYLSLYLILGRLRLNVILVIAALTIIAFLEPFVQLHSFLWSETLFIALCIAAGWVALRLVSGQGEKSDWLAFLGLLAAGSAIRLVGVASVAWILPVLLRRRHLRAAFRLIAHPVMSWALVVGALALLVVFLFADALGLGTRGGFGPTQILGAVAGGLALLLGVGVLVLTRTSRIRRWSATADAGPGGADLWPAAAVAASALPVLLWFLRNEILYGAFSLTNRAFEVFHPERLWAPFDYFLKEILAVRHLPAVGVAVCVAVLLVLPFVVRSRARALAQACLLSAALAQFAAVWIPSLASEISALGHRLLSPSIALLAIAALHGLQAGLDALSARRWAPAILILPLAYIALGRSVVPGELLSAPAGINYPVETRLWHELHEIEWVDTSTHFYSDRDFVHQVFAGMPQRIIWDTSVLRDPDAVSALLGTGRDPFFLVREGSWEAGRLEELMASGQVLLEKIDFAGYGFVLYYGAG